MSTDAFVACSRFGLGARPGELAKVAGDPRGWLRAQLYGPDVQAEHTLRSARPSEVAVRSQVAMARADDDARMEMRRAARDRFVEEAALHLSLAAGSKRPFRERLVAFWSNHFTVSVARKEVLGVAASFQREVVRAHLGGSFADMLVASTRHPAMLAYLDNIGSTGPGSRAGQRRGKGLNENLAREVLELHTLGVRGGYDQDDVLALAKLLTGWSLDVEDGLSNRMALAMGADPSFTGGFGFHAVRHEPGTKRLLGRNYPSGEAAGVQALRDLAQHPGTARHIATKLARHFVADEPPEAAVSALEQAYRTSGGDLPTVHAALVELPQPWEQPLTKVRTPIELVVATARALDAADRGTDMLGGARLMGQLPWSAPSPKGWSDEAVAWTGPEQVLSRIEWLQRVARDAGDRSGLELAEACCGPVLSETTRDALADDDLLVALASPEFQRR